jgi:hypothetical protein
MSGWGNEMGSQGELTSKAALAEAQAHDAQRARPPVEAEDIHWPVGAVVRIALIAIAALVIVGWLLTVFNH